MGTLTYLGEMFNSSAVFLEVLSTGIAKEPHRTGPFVRAEKRVFKFFPKVAVRLQWAWPIRKVSTLGTPSKKSEMEQHYWTCQGSRCHLLES